MIFFRRRRRKTEESSHDAPASVEQDPLEDSSEASSPSHGPWDLDQQPEIGTRVDVGGLRVPARKGMQMRMELESKSRRIVAVNLVYQGSSTQLQPFAAPKSAGIWQDLREEIAESIGKQGGSVQEREGCCGTELLARLPVRTKDGRSGLRPVRFIGVDGPRWFLRAVITGKAAVDDAAAEAIEDILKDIVVVRGEAPRPPRELLPLHLPGKPGEETAPTRPPGPLDNRGPEITEVG